MTPTATRFLVRYLGFTDPEIRRLHAYPESAKVPGNDPLTERVNGHLCWPQDFAIIAKKPEQALSPAYKVSPAISTATGSEQELKAQSATESRPSSHDPSPSAEASNAEQADS